MTVSDDGAGLSAELAALDTVADDVLAITGQLTPQERIQRMLDRRMSEQFA